MAQRSIPEGTNRSKDRRIPEVGTSKGQAKSYTDFYKRVAGAAVASAKETPGYKSGPRSRGVVSEDDEEQSKKLKKAALSRRLKAMRRA